MPPLLDFGTVQGLAYRHNYQQDIANLHQEEQLDAMAKQRAKNETAEMANMFKFGAANNEYDRNNLRAFTDSKVKEMGTYFNQNPDWKYDVGKTLYAKQMSDQLLNNEHVKRSMYYDSQVKATQDYLEKNPNILSAEELNKYKTQMQNRAKFGDIDGPGGKGGDYTFVPPPPPFDVAKFFDEHAKNVPKDQISKLDNETNQITAKDDNIRTYVNSLLLNDKYKRGVQLGFNNEPESVKSKYANDPNALLNYSFDQTKSRIQPLFRTNQSYLESLRAANARNLKGMSLNEAGVNPFLDEMNSAASQIAGTQKTAKTVPYLGQQAVVEKGKEGIGTLDLTVPFVKALADRSPDRGSYQDAYGNWMETRLPSGVKLNPTAGGVARLVNGKMQPFAGVVATMTPEQLSQMFPTQEGESILDEDGNISDKKIASIVTKSINTQGMPTYSLNVNLPFAADKQNALLYNKTFGVTDKKSQKMAMEENYNTSAPNIIVNPDIPNDAIQMQDGSLWKYNEQGQPVPYEQQ
jgi:hypothetical protein